MTDADADAEPADESDGDVASAESELRGKNACQLSKMQTSWCSPCRGGKQNCICIASSFCPLPSGVFVACQATKRIRNGMCLP